MKTERRHELHHNLLADWIEKQTLAIKPYVNVIIGSAIALLLISLVYMYVSHRSAAAAAEGCDQLFSSIDSGTPEALNKVVDGHGRDPAGLWAQVLLAEQRLASGTNALFANRNDADEQLQKSISGFQNVYSSSHDSDQLQRAVWGLGRAHESRMVIDPKEELAKAKDAYKEYVTKWENGPFAAMANRRLEELNRDDTLDFFNWLAKEKPFALPPPDARPSFKSPLDDLKFGSGGFNGTGPLLPGPIRSDSPVDFKFGKPGDDKPLIDSSKPDSLKLDTKTPDNDKVDGEKKSELAPKPETPSTETEEQKPAADAKQPVSDAKPPASDAKSPAADVEKPAEFKPSVAKTKDDANAKTGVVKKPAVKDQPVTSGSKPTK